MRVDDGSSRRIAAQQLKMQRQLVRRPVPAGELERSLKGLCAF